MPLNRTLEEQSKRLYRSLDHIDKVTKRAHNRFRFHDPRFAERYLNGRLKLQLSGSFLDGSTRDVPNANTPSCCKFVAVFQREPPDGSVSHRLAFHSLRPIIQRQPHREVGIRRADYEQNVMLIRDVKVVQLPEGMPIPSLVRLQFSEHLQRVGMDPFLDVPNCPRAERGLTFRDGKRSVLVRPLVVCEDELFEEEVEGSAEVVDCIASDQTPERWRFLQDPDGVRPSSSFRVFLFQDFICLLGGKQGILEFSDVVFRPIELELMTVDSISHEVAL
jgi:hypothetical protein